MSSPLKYSVPLKGPNPSRMLVVSREPASLGALWSPSRSQSWDLEVAASGCEALERIQENSAPDLVLLDLSRDDKDAFYTLRWLKRMKADLAVVLLAPSDDPAQRAEALRLGARDYLVKPLELHHLEQIGRYYFGEREPLVSESQDLLGDGMVFIAASPASRRLRAQLQLLSPVDVPLLIVGESGSGKESTARLIHKLSARSAYSFHVVNCAALSGDLLERELFGYEPNSFPGATRSRAGKLELADKGTLLLDDITEIPLRLQAKLLHVLQEGQFVRLGGEAPIRCDVRFVATSGSDLGSALAGKRLREDLFYRLSAFTVSVPPLRQRVGEIPQLLGNFMRLLAAQYGLPLREFPPAVLDACQYHSWPGNLRELEGFVKRYLIMGDEHVLLSELRRDFESVIAMPAAQPELDAPIEATDGDGPLYGLRSLVQSVKGEAEKAAIAEALEETRWNRKAAARLLQVSYRTLLYKIQHYNMTPPAAIAASFSGQAIPRSKPLRALAPTEITEPRQ